MAERRNFFRWLFGMCEHQWATADTFDVARVRDNSTVGKVYVMRCEKCGAMKNHRALVAR